MTTSMLPSNALPLQRSWTAVVQGRAAEADTAPVQGDRSNVKAEAAAAPESTTKAKTTEALQPGLRGSRRCFCRGEVLIMLGHYGWISASQGIDHPDAWKNGGRIYVHRRDARGSLIKGDIVAFYLYADSQGLGAEECRVEFRAGTAFNADAAEFVPTSCVPSSMRAEAGEFIPRGSLDLKKQPGLTEVYAPIVEAGGDRTWKDVKSLPNVMKSLAHALALHGEDFCDSGDEASLSELGYGDDSDSNSDAGRSGGRYTEICQAGAAWRWDSDAPLAVHPQGRTKPPFTVADCEESTSAGTRSDSEAGSTRGSSPRWVSMGSSVATFSRPPGLPSPATGPLDTPLGLGFMLPPGMQPPPGLELPPCMV